jgi:transcription initiation factor TFIIA large subunit
LLFLWQPSDCIFRVNTPPPQADKEETGDVGFALYEKVHRAKSRWRCNLRYGVFLINGKEYMFNKGSTDFMF